MKTFKEYINEAKHMISSYSEWGWITDKGEYINGLEDPRSVINTHSSIKFYNEAWRNGWIRFYITPSYDNTMTFNFDSKTIGLLAIQKAKELIDTYPAEQYFFDCTNDYEKTTTLKNDRAAKHYLTTLSKRKTDLTEKQHHSYKEWGWITPTGDILSSASSTDKFSVTSIKGKKVSLVDYINGDKYDNYYLFGKSGAIHFDVIRHFTPLRDFDYDEGGIGDTDIEYDDIAFNEGYIRFYVDVRNTYLYLHFNLDHVSTAAILSGVKKITVPFQNVDVSLDGDNEKTYGSFELQNTSSLSLALKRKLEEFKLKIN